MPHTKQSVKVGISVGDINGVGMEVIMKTLSDNRVLDNITAVVYGSGRLASYYKKALDYSQFSFVKIDNVDQAKINKPNLVSVWEDEVKITMGESTEDGGAYALKSLEAATADLAAGKIDVLVTAPINKNNIQSEGFNFPGHTEYLTKYANAEESLMLMVDGSLRVGVATNHIPLKEVAEALTKELVIRKVKLMAASLEKDFGINTPRIAVLGLNPHAGDNGLLGEEEEEIIIPALEALNAEGISAYGPYAADGLFGSGNYSKFDGVLAMYHDQGLVPFKALSGGNGVNFTAGLPIVRTSPDHGTAFDIVGKGIASEVSFRKAMFAAVDIYNSRKNYKEMIANPLVVKERRASSRER
jgi:4-hydroxythreonine-4-phosphate dehydrogenase